MILLDLIPEGRAMAQLKCRYDEAAIAQFKAVPGCNWVQERRTWVAPIEAANVLASTLIKAKIAKLKGGKPLPFPEPRPCPDSVVDDDLYDYQKEGVDFLADRCKRLGGAFLADDMGLGKAQPVDARVLTPSGWQRIGDLRVGDTVMGRNGATRVTGVFPQGTKPVFVLRTNDGRETRCCAEHLWTVQTPLDRHRDPKRTRVMTLSDLGAVRDTNGNHRWFLPDLTPTRFEKTELPLHPYVLGALLANGSFCTGSIVHSGTEEQRDQIRPLVPSVVHLTGSDNDYRLSQREGLRVKGANPVLNAVKDLGLFGMRSPEKWIPAQYLRASVDQRIGLLQGLMDNDGTVSRDGLVVEYNTTSPRLAEGIVELIRSLGGVARVSTRIPTYTYRGEEKKGKLDHRIRVSLPSGIEPFRVPSKRDRYVPRTKYPPTVAITAIEPDGEAQCVCIRVDAEDKLYITDDYILTHNSVQALRTIQHLNPFGQYGRTLIVCPSVVTEHWREEVARWIGIKAAKITSKYPYWNGIGVMSYGVFANVMLKPHHLEWQSKDGEWFRHETFSDRGKAEWRLGKQKHDDPDVNWRVVTMERPLPRASLVVFDEIHYLASGKAQRSKAAKTYIRERPKLGVIGLSGTPLLARPRDLWHPLELIYPERFGTFFQYGRRYCEGQFVEIDGLDREVWKDDGASNLGELSERLSPLVLRRVKNEVLELPERQRIVLPIELPDRVKGSIGRALAGIESETSIKNALKAAEAHKIGPAAEHAADLVSQGHRVLLLTTRRQTAKDIAKKLRKHKIDAPVATGEDAAEKRRAILNRGKQAAVSTMYAVTTGINLTGFDVVIFVGLDWLPTTLLQCEARVHRIGQELKVTYYYMIGIGSLDEVIRERVIERLDHFVTLMGDKGSDEDQLASTLGHESEGDLIDDIVAMVKRKVQEERERDD